MLAVKSFVDGALVASLSEPADVSTIVVLHGWGRNRWDFAPLMELPAVVAFDLPGFGSSQEPPEVWGAREYAKLVIDALLELGAESSPVVLAGHSFGGRIATCVAAARPDLIRGLALLSAPLVRKSGSRQPLALAFAKRLRRWRLVPNRTLEALRQRYGSADYRASKGRMREIFVKTVNEGYEAELKAIRSPTRLIWGVNDTAAPIENAYAALRLIPSDVELETLDTGHNPHQTHPEVLRRTLVELRRLDR